MALFQELDVKATYHRVRWFFDECYPQIKRKSGSWGDYKSPAITGMPKAPSGGNSSERRMVDHSLYASALYAVKFAMRGCTHDSQLIIQHRFIEDHTIRETKGSLGISGNASFQKLMKQAACEFADCIEPACDYYHVPDDIIPDLHSYKK